MSSISELKRQLRSAKSAFAPKQTDLPKPSDLLNMIADFIDETWYFLLYPDVKATGMSAREHYVAHGYKENRSPHPVFDAEYYLQIYPDVADAGLPAIVHYLNAGGREWRRPCAWISMDHYYANYRDAVAETRTHTILEDFCTSDDRIGAFKFFSQQHYIRAKELAESTPNELLTDYFCHGFCNGINPHPLIELDRIGARGEPHQCIHQFRLLFASDDAISRIPTHELIDPDFYLKKHGSLGVHPIIHYLRHWKSNRSWMHPLFDTGYYARKHGLTDGTVDPLTHFITIGEQQNFRPNHYFDCAFYRRAYADKLAPGQHPLNHYKEHGHLIWFQPAENFGQKYYLTKHPHLTAEGTPALVDFLQHGEAAGYKALPQKPFFDDTEGLSAEQMAARVRQLANRLSSPPKVSVIIPAYKNVEYTLRCIITMLTSGDKTPFEIIVADDRSPDNSGDFLAVELADLPGIKVHINEENLGFLRSCNAAVSHCAGDYLFFLNNDTAVLAGWLDELMGTFERNPDTGLAGSKLIYPTGLLQEAGGIIWNGGACANFGRLDDPGHPDYCYERDVDYISGAAIMIPRNLWDDLGGFSDEYAPAYYEDTDFAMKVREAGRRVILQPLSVVVHYEGISSGTDTSSGVKRFQVINQKKFEQRWATVLPTHGEPGDFSQMVRDRRPTARILMLEAETPRPDKDSGSITTFFYLKLLSELGYRVTFIPDNMAWSGRYSRDLQRLGVRVIHAPYATSAESYILEHGGEYDLFILSRAPVGGELFHTVRNEFPDTPIIFDTVDLHHLRMERQAELNSDPELAGEAHRMKKLELDVIQSADATILVSDFEEKYLRDEVGHFPSVIIPLIYEEYERVNGFADRTDIAFIGGYRHHPNIDAVRYLVDDIWPRFRALETGARLHIIGSHMPPEFEEYSADDIIIVGFVEDLESYLDNIRLTVAPLRYGAGVKGKVGNSLRMGVPVVATRVAAEGMGLIDGEHILVGNDSASLAEQMARAYSDANIWESLSQKAKNHVQASFGIDTARQKLESLVRSLTSGKPSSLK